LRHRHGREGALKHAVLFAAPIVALALLTTTLCAAPRRPLDTDDSYRGEPGSFEFSLGYTTSENRVGDTSDWLEFGLTHTVTDRLEIAVGMSRELEPESGFESLSVETKFSFFDERGGIPGLATSVEFSPGGSSYAVKGISSKTFGPAKISLNLGLESDGNPTSEDAFLYAGSVEYGLLDRLTLVAELDGKGREDMSTQTVKGGVKIAVFREAELDASYKAGLDDADPESEFSIGLTVTN
jgi:hypothetical protein